MVNWPFSCIRRKPSRTICRRMLTTRLLLARREDAPGMLLSHSSSALPSHPCRPMFNALVRAQPTIGNYFGLPRGQATLQHPISADHDILQQGRRGRPKIRIPQESEARQGGTSRNCPKSRAWREGSSGKAPILLHVTSVRAPANIAL